MEEQISDNSAFLQQIASLAQQQDWPLRVKLVNACLPKSSLQDRIAILRDALHILQQVSFEAEFARIDELYKRFDEMEKAEQPKEEKEMVVDDADATRRMDTEALDGGDASKENDFVAEAQQLSQHLTDYVAVLDVMGRILSQDGSDAASLPLPNDLTEQIYALLSGVYSGLLALQPCSKQAQLLQSTLVVGVVDALATLLPYLHDQQLLQIWSSLVSHLHLSPDVATATVSLLWKWTQLITKKGGFADQVNPVCFAEQIAPLLPYLQNGPGELVVQIVNLLSCLLTQVQASPSENASVVEVCAQVVHALDAETHMANAEVLGSVLDFMMTV